MCSLSCPTYAHVYRVALCPLRARMPLVYATTVCVLHLLGVQLQSLWRIPTAAVSLHGEVPRPRAVGGGRVARFECLHDDAARAPLLQALKIKSRQAAYADRSAAYSCHPYGE